MSKLPEFTLPKSYMPPEGKAVGDEWEEMAKFKLKADGKACLVEIGEVAMPGYEDDEDKAEAQPEGRSEGPRNMMEMASMGGMGQGGGY